MYGRSQKELRLDPAFSPRAYHIKKRAKIGADSNEARKVFATFAGL
jgi:hypothetical protein